MRHPGSWRLGGGVGAVAGALLLSVSGFAVPASAVQTAQTGGASPTPVTGYPALTTSGPYEAVRELKQCGDTMFAVGQFTHITQSGTTYTRDNVFSFSASPPYTLTSWAPDINGIVDAISFDGGNCSNAYLAGNFTKIGSITAAHIAEVNSTTGAVVSSFAHSANGEIYTLALSGSHLLAGGAFTSINGSLTKYFASLNIKTGKNDGYVNLNISGTYQYAGVIKQATKVYNMQVSHSGGRIMVEGDFTSVGGHARQQIFQGWLGPKNLDVTGWNAPSFDSHCYYKEPYYVRSAAWSTDDNTVYTADTGGHPYLWKNTYPLPGMCDLAAGFSASETTVSPEWTNYTGCDSLYAAVSDGSVLYVGGHPRWANNRNGCNEQGPGGIPDRGMWGLNPANGQLITNSAGTAGLYTMARANADDMIVTAEGVWIASTNRYGADSCGGVTGLTGICLLPYTSSSTSYTSGS